MPCGIRKERRGVNNKGAGMETLPIELSQRIFTLMTYRHLASAAQVSLTWRSLSSQAELWRSLYVQRWGQDKAATVSVSLPVASLWKSAYEVQDRCDRIGTMGWTIIREGDCIYTTQKGHLLQLLACPSRDDHSSPQEPGSNRQTGVHLNSSVDSSQEKCNSHDQMEERATTTSHAGLLDKLLEFVADLHCKQNQIAKRPRIS